MKFTSLFIGALFWCLPSIAQNEDSLGVIGDNLDLYAVLDAFKDAESVEAFEKTINDPDNKINNLDLDEDDQVDYISVYDEGEGDAHAIILRVAMSETEDQDVAVIELEKSDDNEATIQIVGDEEIYGEDYIVEPKTADAVTERLMIPQGIIVNVWGWRGVRFVFAPGYVRWRSPWRWNHHPNYWKPWRPYRWRTYHGFHHHHRAHFHVVKVRRCGRAHGFYKTNRRTCVRIHKHKHHHHNHHAGHNHHNGHGHGHHKNNNGHHKSNGNVKSNNQKQGNGANKKNSNNQKQVKSNKGQNRGGTGKKRR